ncbi:MAG: GtrA family protein [Sphingorhabdus sp.]
MMTSAKQPDIDQRESGDMGRRHQDVAIAIPRSVGDIGGWAQFFRQLTYLRYLIVSLGALAVDLGLFLALLQLAMPSIIASAIGYSAGIVVHWFLSSRKVFDDRVSKKGTLERTQQKAMFVMSALLGLGMTTAIVGAGDALGFDPRIAKIAAIGVSFQLTYLLRNVIIFRTAKTAN